MSGRHIMVEDVCKQCGNTYTLRKTKFLSGKAMFCSKKCFHEYQIVKATATTRGYENGRAYLCGHEWEVLWCDLDGKYHNTSYTKWWWQNNVGPVPDGMIVYFKDGDTTNISPSNFALGTRSDSARANAYKLVGKMHSEETKHHLSKIHTGKVLSKSHKEHLRQTTKKMWENGVFDSALAERRRLAPPKKEHTGLRRGENHPQWRGGTSKEKYPGTFRSLRKRIFERDGHICRICGIYLCSKDGRVHHIDANKYNSDEENLILLCEGCHSAIHSTVKNYDPVILAFRSRLYT